MATWQERLQKASFRGVPFQVESEDSSFGRRVQVHEYPMRDIPYVEDLGRSAREFNVKAFLIGDDYMDQRDRLLSAIEKEGPGPLVHPWYGEIEVSVKDNVHVSHSRQNGGMCEISISFIESGKLEFPSAKISTGKKTFEACDELEEVAIEDFVDDVDLEDAPDFEVDDAVAHVGNLLSEVQGGLGTATALLRNPIADVMENLTDMLPTDELAAAGEVFDMWNGVQGIYGSVSGLPGSVSSILNIGNIMQLLDFLPFPLPVPAVSPENMTSQDRMQSNRSALTALVRRSMIVQSAGMSAAISLPVYDDAMALRGKLCAALDEESLTASDKVYAALQNLRSSVYADITDRTRQSARLQTVTPVQVQPSLAMAYDLYEDVSRAGEIVDRNKVRHPGFIPVEPLKVLSK